MIEDEEIFSRLHYKYNLEESVFCHLIVCLSAVDRDKNHDHEAQGSEIEKDI